MLVAPAALQYWQQHELTMLIHNILKYLAVGFQLREAAKVQIDSHTTHHSTFQTQKSKELHCKMN
jgi:hypothetical protein